MATFTWIPDFGASGAFKPRVRTTSFGDGYEQRVGDGINSNPAKWSVRFTQRTDAETNAITAFLEARGGTEAFSWTPPQATDPIRGVCREWERVSDRHNLNSVSAQFAQNFEP